MAFLAYVNGQIYFSGKPIFSFMYGTLVLIVKTLWFLPIDPMTDSQAVGAHKKVVSVDTNVEKRWITITVHRFPLPPGTTLYRTLR